MRAVLFLAAAIWAAVMLQAWLPDAHAFEVVEGKEYKQKERIELSSKVVCRVVDCPRDLRFDVSQKKAEARFRVRF